MSTHKAADKIRSFETPEKKKKSLQRSDVQLDEIKPANIRYAFKNKQQTRTDETEKINKN